MDSIRSVNGHLQLSARNPRDDERQGAREKLTDAQESQTEGREALQLVPGSDTRRRGNVE